MIPVLPNFQPNDAWTRFASTREASEATGNTIVVAIDQFHRDRGVYPERLADLVPAYLPVIPRPADGDGFFFERKDESYRLSFGFWFSKDIDLYPRCSYSSEKKEWEWEA